MRVLVTGSTQGIGKAIAAAFAAGGHEVFVHGSKDKSKVEAARVEIGAAHGVVADLSLAEEAKNLYTQTGDVDILILNASVQMKEKWYEISEENLDKQLAVNIKSTLLLLQAYVPHMKESGFGRVVALGSVNQNRVHPELSLYSATKCAVERLMKNVAADVAPFGVTVNTVSPGAIATPRNQEVLENEDKRRAVEKSIPMGRFGAAEDCVGAVLLLCGEQGAYITGTDIIIDGGLLLK